MTTKKLSPSSFLPLCLLLPLYLFLSEMITTCSSSTSSASSLSYENQFIYAGETYYNDYAQAWRLLGFYVDCNAPYNNNNECDWGNDGHGDDDNDNDDENGEQQPPCQRFLLWAAVSIIHLPFSSSSRTRTHLPAIVFCILKLKITVVTL